MKYLIFMLLTCPMITQGMTRQQAPQTLDTTQIVTQDGRSIQKQLIPEKILALFPETKNSNSPLPIDYDSYYVLVATHSHLFDEHSRKPEQRNAQQEMLASFPVEQRIKVYEACHHLRLDIPVCYQKVLIASLVNSSELIDHAYARPLAPNSLIRNKQLLIDLQTALITSLRSSAGRSASQQELAKLSLHQLYIVHDMYQWCHKGLTSLDAMRYFTDIRKIDPMKFIDELPLSAHLKTQLIRSCVPESVEKRSRLALQYGQQAGARAGQQLQIKKLAAIGAFASCALLAGYWYKKYKHSHKR